MSSVSRLSDRSETMRGVENQPKRRPNNRKVRYYPNRRVLNVVGVSFTKVVTFHGEKTMKILLRVSSQSNRPEVGVGKNPTGDILS